VKVLISFRSDENGIIDFHSLIKWQLPLSTCNLLLVLDCCHAGAANEARDCTTFAPNSWRRIACLACCGADYETPFVEGLTFTSVFTNTMRYLLHKGRSAPALELLGELTERSCALEPLFFPLSSDSKLETILLGVVQKTLPVNAGYKRLWFAFHSFISLINPNGVQLYNCNGL
jgi:hypothetical protein